MKKKLIFYWYVNPNGWNEIYELHLKNLQLYKDVFDEKHFVFSFDKETDFMVVLGTIEIIHNAIPDMQFSTYKNDKNLRESFYFYNEIATKLDCFDRNDIVFFAHNKGLASNYMSHENLFYWINIMYFANLNNIEKIDEYINDNNVYCIGTFLLKDWKAWPFLKYCWHYSGTFFWFKPNLINELIQKNNEHIPENERYFTEAFLGSVIPYNDKNVIAIPNVYSYKNDYYKTKIKNFLAEFSEEEQKYFHDIYG